MSGGGYPHRTVIGAGAVIAALILIDQIVDTNKENQLCVDDRLTGIKENSRVGIGAEVLGFRIPDTLMLRCLRNRGPEDQIELTLLVEKELRCPGITDSWNILHNRHDIPVLPVYQVLGSRVQDVGTAPRVCRK